MFEINFCLLSKCSIWEEKENSSCLQTHEIGDKQMQSAWYYMVTELAQIITFDFFIKLVGLSFTIYFLKD